MGSITSITFIPANTFCELAESITRWKWAKRKCKTFRLLHHRVIELTSPSTTIARRAWSFGIWPVTQRQKRQAVRAGNNLALGGRPDSNQHATLHRIALALGVECPAPLKRDVKLLLIVGRMVVFGVVLPVWRHPAGVHAKCREAKTLACEEELLPLLEWAGITLHL